MNKRGFTLIETLIYITIIGGVMLAFVSFALHISDSRNKTYVVQEVQANARVALDLISQKIEAANGVNLDSSTFALDPGVLSLSMASISLNPTVIDLSVDDGVLQINQGTSGAIPITSDEVRVTNLVFTNLTGGASKENIGVALTVEFNNFDGDVEFSYDQSLQTAVSLRQ